jgi:two-component system response regulator BaeR
MSKRKILIVEDERKIAELLRDYLVQDGFAVTSLNRGDEAEAEVRAHPPDLILLDIMFTAGKHSLSALTFDL